MVGNHRQKLTIYWLGKYMIYIPKTEDNRDFGENPNPGFVMGTARALENAADFGLTNEAIDLSRKGLDESEFLSREDFDKSEYKRPGLNFDSGVHVETARRAAGRYDKKLEYEQTIGGINSGFLRGTSQLVGGSVGFMLDPANFLLAAKVPLLVGAKAAPLVEGISSNAARRATQVAIGAGEGAAVVAPQELGSYATDKLYGEDPSVVEPLVNIGLASVLGGAVRGFTGFKEPITHNADNVAKETAVGQMAAGKSVRVDELMQHGAYEADVRARMAQQENAAMLPKTREQIFTEELGDRIRAGQRNKADDTFLAGIQQSREELLPLAGEKLPKADVQNLKQQVWGLRQDIKKLDDSFDTYFERTRSENRQATYKETVKITNKALANDRQPLVEALNAAESRLKNHNVAAAAESELSRIDQSLTQFNKEKSQLRKIFTENSQLEKLFNPLTINKPISAKRLISGDYSMAELMREPSPNEAILHGVRERLQNTVAHTMLDARETKPLTVEQVKSASGHMQSYHSDSTYNRAESEGFRSEVDALPDELDQNIEFAKSQVDDILRDMPEDVKASLASLDEAMGATEKVTNALNKILDCLRVE